jgi:PTH1 family peptidyl-tRNA hydrolase
MAYLFVGLGNPGEQYKNTPHNAGRLALEYVCEHAEFGGWRKERKAKGLLSEGEMAGEEVTFLLPENFMNCSGDAVKSLVRNEKDAERVVIIHDEIDMPIGEIEFAFGKGSGGHNGVQSVIDKLGTKNFIRLRIGITPTNWFGKIAKPKGREAVSDFLLSDFKKQDRERLEESFPKILEALEDVVEKGVKSAMNTWNE